MTELSIVPECYVDTKIAEIIGQTRKCNHQHGCGNVAKQLITRLKDKIALAIVDEDNNKGPRPKYFLEFKQIDEENNLILKKHKERNQYLILICPEIERWLMENANAVNINPLDFNLPENLYGFKQITKRKNIDINIEFYQFIKELIKKEAPGLITLKHWIDSFNKNKLSLN